MSKEFDKEFGGVATTPTPNTPPPASTYKPFNGSAKIDVFKDGEFEKVNPVELDPKQFETFTRHFAIISDNMTDAHKEKVTQIMTAAASKSFTMRGVVGLSTLCKWVESSYAKLKTVEYYFLWASMDKTVTPTLGEPTKLALGIAKTYHKNLAKVPAIVRKLVTRNIHICLGATCNTPLKFIVIYSEDGAEEKSKIVFDKIKNMGFYIEVAEDADIKVFNLYNADAVERIEKFIGEI